MTTGYSDSGWRTESEEWAADDGTSAADGDERVNNNTNVVARTQGSDHDGSTAMPPSEDIRLWKESRWAVGFTKPTWSDEPLCGDTPDDGGGDSEDLCGCCTPLGVTACLCRCSGRVGNMVVLAQTSDRLLCLVGPYWMVLVFVTVPAIAAFSIWVAYTRVADQSLPVIVTWSICTGCLFLALLLTGCRDPGILPRVRRTDNESWRWNDQALTCKVQE